MKATVQVLTTPTADTLGTTLMLNFPGKRYMFGSLAEGTQRACTQIGARLLKVSEVFLSGRTEWRNTGGMIGIILTLADSVHNSQAAAVNEALAKVRQKATRMGYLDDQDKMRQLEAEAKNIPKSRLTIIGPPNLNHTLATGRRFIFRKGTPIDIHEVRDRQTISTQNESHDEWAPTWMDENINVWAMSIHPADKNAQESLRPMSPRKRTIDEANEDGSADHSQNLSPCEVGEISPENRGYLTTKAVVGDMFDSSWRLDTLYETSLSEVQLPATIFIKNSGTHKIEKYHGPLPDGLQELPDPALRVLVRKPWPGALVKSLPPTKPALEALSFIIKSHTQRGRFDAQRAKGLKLPDKRLYTKLASGESVLNTDGETITPDMVLGPSRVGGGFAVADIPSVEYIEGLLSRAEWLKEEVMAGVGAIFWICGRGVAADARVHAFMKNFKHLEHIVSSSDYCSNSIALDSSAASTIKLRTLDPDRYKIPIHDSDSPDGSQPFGGTGYAQAYRASNALPEGVRIAARGDTLQVEPAIKYETETAVPRLDVVAVEETVPELALEEASKSRGAVLAVDDKMNAWINSLPPGAKDVEIITLGTGSALPSKYRNVSATMVLVPGWGNLLFDCGENTIGQLGRVFGEAELRQVLRDLKLVSISHMHADHHLGMAGVLKRWYDEVHGGRPAPFPSITDPHFDVNMEALFHNQHRLAVVAEHAFHTWMYEYSSVEDFGYSRIAPLVPPTIHSEHQILSADNLRWHTLPSVLEGLGDNDRARRLERSNVPLSMLGLAGLKAAFVEHCHGARALSIEWPSGLKISYSGDCRPSKLFAKIGKDSTVCIHEATFDNELQGDAIAKKHSTTSEALSIAEKMRAKACVLTHFSQRYQKIPIMERAPASEMEVVEEDNAASNAASVMDQDDDNAVAAADHNSSAEDYVNTFGPDTDTYADPGITDAGSGQQYDLPEHSAPKLKPENSKAGDAVTMQLKSDMKVGVAFDYMRVKVGDIGHLEKFTPALLALFEKEEEDPGADGGSDGQGPTNTKAARKKDKSARRN